ncbi:hypothetical protein WN943_016836 [Citrus x changshan-huyou]
MEGKEHAQTPRLPSNRSDLIDDLLISILARLSPLEIICTSMVCSSWNRIVRSSSHSRRAEAPWLLLPSETEEGEDVDDHERSCPPLLNPSSSTRILLPPPETILDIVRYLDGEGYTSWIVPILSHGEVAWHSFNGASQSGYSDVVCTADNRVYALSTFANNYTECTVEAWDFKQHVPVMLMQVTAPLLGQLEDISTPVVVNSYVVESLASILCCAPNAESSAPNNYRKIKDRRIAWFGN